VSDIDPVAWKPVGWDWLSGFRRFVAQQDPDVVVVEFIGVHFPFDSYARMPVGSAAFHDAWLRAANEAMAILTSRGATVYWVVPPPMRDKWWADQTDVVRDITRGLAKGWPPAPGRDGVQYIDEFQPFQLGGAYAEALPGPDGRLVTVRRRSDGVHLTDAGIQRYVDRLVGVLERYDTGRFRVA
jgi:hypothetical protein